MSELPAQVLSWLGRHVLTLSLLVACYFAALPLQAQERPPVVPLVTHDPYFSIWSMADHLTDIDTRHWTGVEQPLAGLIRIDNVPYRYMGADPRQVPAMQQVSLEVTPLHTIYTFETAGVRLQVTFFTAAFPNDLDALSRPVDYLTWNITSTDGRAHAVDLLLDVSPVVAVNTNDQDVTWGRSMLPGMQVLRVGSRDQRVLNREGDNLRIDWGYFYLAVPDQPGATLATVNNAMQSFVASGNLAQSDDMDMPLEPRNRAAHLAVDLPRPGVSGRSGQPARASRLRRRLLDRVPGPQAAPLLAPWEPNSGRHVGRV